MIVNRPPGAGRRQGARPSIRRFRRPRGGRRWGDVQVGDQLIGGRWASQRPSSLPRRSWMDGRAYEVEFNDGTVIRGPTPSISGEPRRGAEPAPVHRESDRFWYWTETSREAPAECLSDGNCEKRMPPFTAAEVLVAVGHEFPERDFIQPDVRVGSRRRQGCRRWSSGRGSLMCGGLPAYSSRHALPSAPWSGRQRPAGKRSHYPQCIRTTVTTAQIAAMVSLPRGWPS